MSRIGKNPVSVPSGVTVEIIDNLLRAKGKLGEQSFTISDDVQVSLLDNIVTVAPKTKSKRARSMWGTTRARINNMLVGVGEGFTIKLEINGVGYRAALKDKQLNLQLGYSHDINFDIPEDIKIVVEKQTILKITGSDKQQVGTVASKIKTFRKIEPYKGKGVREQGQYVLKKEGKKK